MNHKMVKDEESFPQRCQHVRDVRNTMEYSVTNQERIHFELMNDVFDKKGYISIWWMMFLMCIVLSGFRGAFLFEAICVENLWFYHKERTREKWGAKKSWKRKMYHIFWHESSLAWYGIVWRIPKMEYINPEDALRTEINVFIHICYQFFPVMLSCYQRWTCYKVDIRVRVSQTHVRELLWN